MPGQKPRNPRNQKLPPPRPLILFSSVAGCDSIIYYQISLFALDTAWLSDVTCVAAQAGIFIETLVDRNGCDSTVITVADYLPPADTTVLSRLTCDPFQEDEYMVLAAAGGCDSILFVDYTYQALSYELTITPDQCLEGAGALEVTLPGSPGYDSIVMRLYSLAPPAFIGEGLSYAGLTGGLYRLETLAGSYCEQSEEIDIPSIGGAPPVAGFTYMETSDFNRFSFQAGPIPGEQPLYRWDFGDGRTGEGREADNNYPYPGFYEACLAVSNECGQDISCQEVVLPLRLEAVGAGGQPGERLALPVIVNGAYHLAHLNMAIWFLSPEVARIDSLSPAGLAANGTFQHQLSPKLGYINMSWQAENPPGITLEQSDTLFLIYLTLIGQPLDYCTITTPEEPGAYFFFDGQEAEPHYVAFFDSEVFITFPNATGSETDGKRPELFQNQPNPFRQETSIPFFLPHGGKVELVITGPLGRVVERHENYYPAGRHLYHFRARADKAAGVYTYTLRTAYGVASLKMVCGE